MERDPSTLLAMSNSFGAVSAQADDSASFISWLCVRTQPGREMFAHTFLKKLEKVESFLPRIRFRRHGTPPRAVDHRTALSRVPADSICGTRPGPSTSGVSGLIRFGNHCPIVPDEVIQQLQSSFGAGEAMMVEHPLRIGDRVLIESGSDARHRGHCLPCVAVQGPGRAAAGIPRPANADRN